MAKFQLGTYQHKKLFCGLLSETSFSLTPLSSLDPETKQRLGELDLWSWLYNHLQTSGRVAQGFAQSAKGDLLKGAIAQLGSNNLAIAQSIKTLCKKNRVDISINNGSIEPPTETSFRQYCHESNMTLFFACGLYELAKQENYFQVDLLDLWDTALDMQACHAIFFINWLAFGSNVRQKPDYEITGLLSFLKLRSQWFALLNKLDRSEYDDNLPNNPKEIDYLLGKRGYREFLKACEMGYQPRLEPFDSRLRKPRSLLKASGAMRSMLGFWPQRVSATRPSSV